jgi:hypothetical protein
VPNLAAEWEFSPVIIKEKAAHAGNCTVSLTVIHSWSWTERVSLALAMRRGNTEVAATRVALASSGVMAEISSALGNRLVSVMVIPQLAAVRRARLSSNHSASRSPQSAFRASLEIRLFEF